VTGLRPALALIAAAALAFALAGCDRESGAEIDEGGFGNPTMNNMQFMTGERVFVQALGERFAREVPDTVNFDFDSAVLDAEAQAILRRQADWIRQFPEVRFRVYGHTDLVGTDAYNRALGLRRANAVVDFLVSQGISRSRLEAVVSFGRTRPLIQTADPERRNRRTVTEVTGFVQRHPTVLQGKYAEVIFREYIRGEAGAIFRHPQNAGAVTAPAP
jgi:outer membrane protein OmpA-like peptidoglycan-associated protein